MCRVETVTPQFRCGAFTTPLGGSARTDRVRADRWESAPGLVDGAVTVELLATLRV